MNFRSPETQYFLKHFAVCAGTLTLVLGVLFFEAFLPGNVVFSNDGPLGGMVATQNRLPETFTGLWVDLNWIGFPFTSPAPSVSSALRWVTTPVIWSKIYPAFSLLFVGLSAWYCFWRFKFRPLACLLGGIAATLNADFFGTACWGVASQTIAFGAAYLALGWLADMKDRKRWVLVPLAGFAVGTTINEAYDIGALFSLAIAAFVFVQPFFSEGSLRQNLIHGMIRLAIVTVCAFWIAASTLSTIISTQIIGVVGSKQDAETKVQRWAEATLASLPKKETLGIVVPGLFGFRGDTPNGGAYWGTGGSDPGWDKYLESDRKGPPPNGPLHGGMGSNYAGTLVILGVAWSLVQLLRGKKSEVTSVQRKQIGFFVGVAIISMLLMFGRFAPFYQIFYALPFASIMRNPAKFLHLVEWSLIILSVYGFQDLIDRYVYKPKMNRPFDRKWIIGSFVALGIAIVAGLAYASQRGQIEARLAELTQLTSRMQLDASTAAEAARATIGFSLGQVTWAIVFLGLGIGLVALIVRGVFSGSRANSPWIWILPCILLAVDLGWQNRPWIIIWNWKEKYVEAGDNPVIAFLRQHPEQHRVSGLPNWLTSAFRIDPRVANAQGILQSVYATEWMQQVFQYYNIQCLDVIQLPRRPIEYEAFEQALQFGYNTNTLHHPVRKWRLTNTRFLVGAAPLVGILNQGLDPEKQRFQPRLLFEYYQPRAGGPILTRTNTTGPFAVIEFTGALPRAKLYTNWKVAEPDSERIKSFVTTMRSQLPPFLTSAFDMVATNELATLEQLADKSFDPEQTVLLSAPISGTTTSNGAPTVEYTAYRPRHFAIKTKSEAAGVLLVNDKYDPDWQVFVDGKRAPLLRCNYVMRGVEVPAGEHQVRFRYAPATKYFWISLAAAAVTLVLIGCLCMGQFEGDFVERTLGNKSGFPTKK